MQAIELDAEVDDAMDRVRESQALTEEQPRALGIAYLQQVAERCEELAGELLAELAKEQLQAGGLPKPPKPCSKGCPGWGVFDAGSGLEVQRCDECWSGVENAPGDEVFQAQAVCLIALSEAAA